MTPPLILTPFLQYFLQFYGTLTLHLRPVSQHNRYSWFNLLTNLFLLSLFIFCHLVILRNSDRQALHHHMKPLLKLAYNAVGIVFPSLYTCLIGYFFLVGPRITLCLNSTCFQSIFPNASRSKVILVLLFLIDIATVIVMFYNLIVFSSIQTHIQLTFAKIYICIVGFYSQILIFRLYQIFLIASYQVLREELLNQRQPLPILFNKIIQLARINGKLNRLLALPMLLVLLTYALDLLDALCLLSSGEVPLLSIEYLIVDLINLFVITYYANGIQKTLKEIEKQKQFKFDLNENNNLPIFDRTFESQNEYIRFRQITFYQDYFRLSLFSLANLDNTFLFGLTLLVIYHCVLLTQTK